MFTGKESSNRIELSRLVQDLLNFGVSAPCRSGEGAGGWGIWGPWGVSPHTYTHICMHPHTHAHVYMYRNCKWPPTWRHPCLACLTCMCVRACVCMHVYMGHSPTHPCPPPPPSTHLPPPRGGPPESLKIR